MYASANGGQWWIFTLISNSGVVSCWHRHPVIGDGRSNASELDEDPHTHTHTHPHVGLG